LKTDSFVVESQVCFPSDIKLLFQSADKCLSLIGKIRSLFPLSGWGKLQHWHKALSKSNLIVSRVYRHKGRNYTTRLKKVVRSHLSFCAKLRRKIEHSLLTIKALISESSALAAQLLGLFTKFISFVDYFDKHQDLVKRRVLLEETIPHKEKIFSIYEPHTEWISKGKSNKKVELGHAVCITTNQQHFCLHWQVMEKQSDVQMPVVVKDFITEHYPKYKINAWSFDRNFGSKQNREELGQTVDCLVMPKKGKLSEKSRAQEQAQDFRKYKRKHATVEANIAHLEHLGAGKCPDKGIEGFKRYVGLSVLAYNLHRLGKIRINAGNCIF